MIRSLLSSHGVCLAPPGLTLAQGEAGWRPPCPAWPGLTEHLVTLLHQYPVMACPAVHIITDYTRIVTAGSNISTWWVSWWGRGPRCDKVRPGCQVCLAPAHWGSRDQGQRLYYSQSHLCWRFFWCRLKWNTLKDSNSNPYWCKGGSIEVILETGEEPSQRGIFAICHCHSFSLSLRVSKVRFPLGWRNIAPRLSLSSRQGGVEALALRRLICPLNF